MVSGTGNYRVKGEKTRFPKAKRMNKLSCLVGTWIRAKILNDCIQFFTVLVFVKLGYHDENLKDADP
jgi:hypothetical protein